MNSSLTHRSLVAAVALVAASGLAACSGDDSEPSPAETATQPIAAPVDPALVGLVGPGCAAYVAESPKGAASIGGMSGSMLTVATDKNPLLGSLNKAISGRMNKKVKLIDTLDAGEYTVFAPVDAAFARLPATTVAKLKTDGPMLTKLLTYHVVPGQLSPQKVVGTHKTFEGADVKVRTKLGALTVDDANVICGGIRTANATFYLIDQVLTPPK
jgi:uncharacterized surface protein with fasciclin (FAS1) repeats